MGCWLQTDLCTATCWITGVLESTRPTSCAPAALAWVDVPGTEYVGLLSPWIDGAAPEALDERLAAEVVRTMDRLHADRALAAHLPAPAAPRRA